MSKIAFTMSRFLKVASPFAKTFVPKFVKPKPLVTFAASSSLLGFLYYNSQKIYAQENLVREVETIDASEINDGEMKTVKIGPTDDDTIVIYKVEGKYYATAAKCPHSFAPLEKGMLLDDKVFCPWHGATFSVVTGQPDQGPVFNNLPTYEVFEDKGKLIVKVPQILEKSIQPEMKGRYKADFRKYVILGGGVAALSAAETLRQSGFGGEIIMITNESDLPYDRTVLSKNVLNTEIDKITIRDQGFFDKFDVAVLRNTHVKYINIDKNVLEFDTGKEPIKFDKLLIATGGRTRVPPVSGTGLQNVMTLRNYKDVQDIKEAALKSKRIVIVGASFIGMEVAASLKKDLKDNAEIIVVEKFKAPFSRVLGEDVGNAIKGLHEKNGVKFYTDKSLKSIEGAGEVNSIVLEDGTRLPADLVILGTGIRPNSDLVEKSIRISDDGGIYTDAFLQTSVDGVYAAGDVASYPYWYTGSRVRVEHYNEAIQQGQIAAYNMLGKKVPHTSIPFFWSRQYDMSLRYVGCGTDYDNIYIDGDVNALKFVAYYAKENRIIAAASVGRDPAVMVISQAMQANLMPTMDEVRSGKVSVDDIKERVKSKKGCSKCKRKACQERKISDHPK